MIFENLYFTKFGVIFNDYFIAHCQRNAPLKEGLNRSVFDKEMDKSKLAPCYGPRCTIFEMSTVNML